MSLKEKAKTLPEWYVEVRKKGETDCGCCSSIGTKDACGDCAVILSWHPKFIEVSVAQQEIATQVEKAKDPLQIKINALQLAILSIYKPKIESLERERGLLKQKLREFWKWLEQKAWRGVSSEVIDEFGERFEELLK